MNRGIFNSLIETDMYTDANKDWFVTLEHSNVYWYGLLKEEGKINNEVHTKDFIIKTLKYIKKNVEENLEKRFIYFIASRTKVRFNTKKKPFYNPLTKNLTLYIILGKNKKSKIKIKTYDPSRNQYCKPPRVKLSEHFITIENEYQKVTQSIHDFLIHSNTNLNISTEINYVGITKNPHNRPTNSVHAGLNDILYKINTEEKDIFLFFNIFKVNNHAINNSFNINFFTSNSMTNEIDVDKEGSIIEKALILYFNANTQFNNKKREKQELENTMKELSINYKVNTFQLYYELKGYSEYWNFYSSSVEVNKKHIFTIKINDRNKLQLKKESILYRHYKSINAI